MHKTLFIIPLALFLGACGSGDPKLVYLNPQSCNIEAPTNQSIIPVKTEIPLAGWFFDKFTANAKGAMRIQVTSADRKVTKVIPLDALIARSDVSNALKEPLAENSGFSTKIAADVLPPNTYEVSVIKETDSAVVVCTSNALTFTVKE